MNTGIPLKITETVLRDGHQSLAATRMRTSDMLPVLEQLDEIGYFSIEAWGGATFDSCLRFLNEDPWERLRTIKKYLKKTPIQMLLRGQNVLGYNHYADDVVSEFVKRAVDNGVGVIRIFDALNDVRNLEASMRAAKESGAHVQGAFVYTISPYHNNDSFLKVAKDLVSLGSDSICIKDMAGLLAPYKAYELVKTLKAEINIPIHLHTHYTSGMASMTYLKAVEAGVDIIDTALSPFAMASSQPATEAMIAALEGTERDSGLSKEKLFPIADHFRTIKKQLTETFNLNTNIEIDTKVLSFQIPGGMLSNLLNQMKEQGMADKFPDLIEEMPKVRAELGYPPLVTPTSQIVGSMSAFNVMLGRYKVVPREIKDLARGKYGRTPAPIDPEFLKTLIGDDEIITHRPADDIKPQMPALRQELAEKGYPNASTEDVLSYAVFPEVALKFFESNR
ncbi:MULTISPECIES: pyruvate carboxylase subunit B [Sporomusa]|jgi:oxaloacetate decarboxylase alpha subunit|uniref:Methylmalonyl-CoA carboxyltransferase 5S subunit n=2 Tax=Sporomusa TaxID=2375 RepID=A0ABP2CAJ0_9FIRM|nr:MULTISPECIES: pyruvate carboxylase subunit B [Sporomusa]MCM0759172.1 pyruvate carboxylase subunit B [Sporomusa sphaeroides DSM 2875]OLS58785.1 methylmalonyl-CoA carboxyltransferase 5S subunit [Sporomusa sphaeroides DSM 2875]CVK21358.1 Methylmalonyl-CoA carboxyltransferase 5S subunit [Sporomusa sphaeroides DSM 2875]SCM79661.1 Pyruvate carboxylase subunit B [uncultured Sporomusa sp.]HML35254.1 pyruvate carboxylase subunit B [Sporomusa sphaeroides]